MYNCPVCTCEQSISLERRASVPIAQNLIFTTRQQALDCAAGSLAMQRCVACGFVWNAAFDPDLMVYDASYDNDQNFSARFRAHVDAIADHAIALCGAESSLDVVEVGCGQASFLSLLANKLGDRLGSATGYDPAWRSNATGLPPRTRVHAEYFGSGSSFEQERFPDLVVSRHTIEHVPNPLTFLRAIRREMSEGSPLLIETPDVDWTLSGGVFFDFYYEHCSLFTPASLQLAMELSGFAEVEVEHGFEGQYLVASGRAGACRPTYPTTTRDDCGYRAMRDHYLEHLGIRLRRMKEGGGTALWGGASKGVTICLVLPDMAELIDCVIDINERKQNRFLPGSGVEVIAPEVAAERGVRSVLVVNPAYLDEIRASCGRDGLDFDLISSEAL